MPCLCCVGIAYRKLRWLATCGKERLDAFFETTAGSLAKMFLDYLAVILMPLLFM